MSKTRRIVLAASLVAVFLGLPRNLAAVSGCTNSYLKGTYNGQIDNLNYLNAFNMASKAAGNAVFVSNPVGFGNNIYSLADAAGMGRYYFDGAGGISGQVRTYNGFVNLVVGSYAVNDDCTATITLNGGFNYNAVLVNGGAQALFMESDAGGHGAVGSLARSPNTCGPNYSQTPQTYGFSYYGAQGPIAGNTAANATPDIGQLYSAVGMLSLDGQGLSRLSP